MFPIWAEMPKRRTLDFAKRRRRSPCGLGPTELLEDYLYQHRRTNRVNAMLRDDLVGGTSFQMLCAGVQR